MSRPHESLPSLPTERLRVGECVVDVPLREILAPGARRPRRVTPKAMGVLLVLVEHAERVVSRDALLAEVWPGTLPTDDVITQAITQLRKAFDEERGNPRYIETIAKNGYRLLADVEWLETPPSHGASHHDDNAVDHAADVEPEPIEPIPLPATASVARGQWRSIGGAIALVLVLVVMIVWWSLERPEQEAIAGGRPLAPTSSGAMPQIERPYRLITSMPGFELAPTLSPDAALVAYVAIPDGQRATAILIQTTDQTPARQLTRPTGRAEDSAPSWSPDGRSIAFLRIEPGKSCKVLVIAANGGAERDATACDFRSLPTFSWTPDGRGLIFGSMPTAMGIAGLRVLDLASGQWRAVPYNASSANVDQSPRISPDGRWIGFVRNSPLGDFWRIPITGGPPERLSHLGADVRGWDWLPDGKGLLFGRMIDGDVRIFQLDLATGLARDIGIDSAQSPAIASGRPSMAFVQRKPYFGLFQVRLGGQEQTPGGGAVHVVEPLFPSSARDFAPTIAPDGHQLAFVSDRSGTNGLWWADLNEPESLRAVSGVQFPSTRYPASWSPDSRRLIVAGSRPNTGQIVLYEAEPATGRVTELSVPLTELIQGIPLADPHRLLVLAGAGDGRMRLHLYDRSHRPWRLLAALDDVSEAKPDLGRGRVLFTRLTQAGLWQADLDLRSASIQRIDEDEPVADRYRLWDVAIGTGQLRYIDQQQDCLALLRRIGPEATGAPLCLDQSRRSAMNGFSLSPQGDVIYLALAKWDGADIGFMDLPQEPKTFAPGWAK